MVGTYICTFLTGKWPQSRPELGMAYVEELWYACSKFAPQAEFRFFSDRPCAHPDAELLPKWLPGWWSKLYAFAPHNFPLRSRVLVLDLDTVVAGRLDEVLDAPLDKPIFIRDAHFRRHAGSGAFMFEAGEPTARIWADFPKGAKGPPFMHPTGGPKVTDEHWIHHYIQPDKWRGWDEVLPGRVLSYKHELHQSCEPLPPDCRIVFFDGEPRPHDVLAPWNPMGKWGHPNG